eukprot:15459763-Alexandrium_andersonii.AAC.1
MSSNLKGRPGKRRLRRCGASCVRPGRCANTDVAGRKDRAANGLQPRLAERPAGCLLHGRDRLDHRRRIVDNG